MSISGLSSTTPYAATLASSNMSQRRADFHALGSALQSGDGQPGALKLNKK